MSSSTDINCGYGDNGNYHGILGFIYQCEVANDPKIETKESIAISTVTGTHRFSKTDQSVLGIRAEGKTMRYFPQGLKNFFQNLKVIDFYRVEMVEIHQADLKPFPDLVVLYLGFNKVQVLESGLFDHNPQLEVIAFPHNELKHIYGNIFDHLSKLSRFWFKGNDCINSEFNTRDAINTAIEHIKEHCTPVGESSSESENNVNMREHSDEIYSSGEYTIAPDESSPESENNDNILEHSKEFYNSGEYTAAPKDCSEESHSTEDSLLNSFEVPNSTEGTEPSTGYREQCANWMIFGFLVVILSQISH